MSVLHVGHLLDPPVDDITTRDELQRQHQILLQEMPIRLLTTALAYVVCCFFINGWIVLGSALLYFSLEIMNMRLLKSLSAQLQPALYRRWLCQSFLAQTLYVLPPCLIWYQDSEYARAFAIGMIMARMMHLNSITSMHLPLGVAGLSAIGVMVLGTNTIFWPMMGDWMGLFLSSACVVAAMGYCLSSVTQTNALHRENVSERARARAANAAKSRFLAQMSHELRTPLNAIIGMGHAELATAPTAGSRERLGILVDAAGSLALILDDILDISEIGESALSIRAAPTDPRSVVEATVALFRPQYEGAGLSILVEYDTDLPAFGLLDTQRIRQCLSNLLSNALKYTRTGGVAIWAGMTPEGALRLIVSDTGTGVDHAERDKIFEPFQRGISSEKGSGLGLAISRALARQMGGDLVLKPSARGARFCLTVAMPIPPELPEPRPAHAPATLDLKGKRLLVVDDIATNRLVAATYLRLAGALVMEADGGQAAVEFLRTTPVDMVLMDMNMPGMDGIEALNRIRALGAATSGLPVIAMTADAAEAHRARYLAAGLDGYVAKPLSQAGLARALQPFLANDLARSA